ncbi:MAG: DUF86 domain-containing protein [Actinobacteria bacterium]|nr:DUF86 domain-containing protein [Actinomycetota bacterium]
MKRRDHLDYLQDILESIDDVQSFVAGMSYEDFANDRKTVNAVIRSIEVIGESARAVPDSVKRKNPSIPWEKMVSMRNKLIHEYFGVDIEIIWQTIQEDISPLRDDIAELISKEE